MKKVMMMLNVFAQFFLAATALSPILGAVAVNKASDDPNWNSWLPWLLGAVALASGCLCLLRYAARNGEKHELTVKEFEDKDKEVLAFLLAYLLPFVAKDKLEFKNEWMTGMYIMIIVLFTIARSGSFHFNPVMSMFYRFYSVKDEDGVSNLLISRKQIRKAKTILTVRISNNIYLALKNE